MNYHLARGGQSLGQFSEDQVRAGLADGQFVASDLCWTEGMSDWKPVVELFGSQIAGSVLPSAVVSSPAPFGAPNPTSGLAIASLVCGIASLLSCVCCLLMPAPIAAVVCGHLALKDIASTVPAKEGRGMAIAGLVMGYVGIVLVIVGTVFGLANGFVQGMAEAAKNH